MLNSFCKKTWLILLIALIASSAHAEAIGNAFFSFHNSSGLLFILFTIIAVTLAMSLHLYIQVKKVTSINKKNKKDKEERKFHEFISSLNSDQLDTSIKYIEQHGKQKNGINSIIIKTIVLAISFLSFQTNRVLAQGEGQKTDSLFTETGVIITLILILVPVIGGIILMILKVRNILTQYKKKRADDEAKEFASYLNSLSEDQVTSELRQRKKAIDYHLNSKELSGSAMPDDSRGLIHNIKNNQKLPFVAVKRTGLGRPSVEPELAKLILAFLSSATIWLVLGTTIGEYVGIKFVIPDIDHVSWLSFGRLRPVHTNMVFWGWSSMAMLGLGYYVVPRVSNVEIYSIKKGWQTLYLINATIILGSLCLVGGINNGGGEYREYIWPVMILFAIGIAITLQNFVKTVASRTTKEIYISNWYIVGALMFLIVISVIAYLPWWQDGLSETITQGYYMHQGVGMWFMLFTLGIVLYFLPQQLNKPIYSYSLGILAFWTQILFYTLIGSHHFVFSSIPWWLQTVAIVGSVGMIIPVAAGTTNFIMTFKGSWYKVSSSYTLPFFLVGIIFYFTGSMQGTAEAFRTTNLYWHFTDFTVAHSHLTMYGIITFFLWAAIYALVPRITGREAPQITVGIHFWLALIGLLFYTVPLMYGSTLKGLLWTQGKPFLDGVVLMAPYWLWRAIGGSLMLLAHCFFAYNMYKMIIGVVNVDIKDVTISTISEEYNATV